VLAALIGGAVRAAQLACFFDRVSRDRHPVADRRLVQTADRVEEISSARRIRRPRVRRESRIALLVLVGCCSPATLRVELSSYYIST